MLNLPLKPRISNYFLTFRCESTCEFCIIWQRKEFRGVEEAPAERVKHNLTDLKRLGVQSIDFTGGEPTLREDLPEILKEAKRLNFFTTLTTDGTRYLEQAEKIKGLVDTLSFSLDAPERKEHNRIRGRDCFDLGLESLKKAKELGEKPVINFTITRDSIRFIPEMIELAEKEKVFLHFNPVFDHFGLQGFEPISIGYLKRYFRHKLALINLAVLEFISAGGNNPFFPRCRADRAVITIYPDNSFISPCLYDQKKKIKIENNLFGLYNQARERAGKDAVCSRCVRWDYIVPSFYYRLDKYFFLNLYSNYKNLRKGVEIK